jgi:hypothetical protein
MGSKMMFTIYAAIAAVFFLIFGSEVSKADPWGAVQTIEHPDRPVGGRFGYNMTFGGERLFTNRQGASEMRVYNATNNWAFETAVPERGMILSPNGRLAASWASAFAVSGGDFAKLYFVDPQLRFEDQVFQEFGAYETRFAEKIALSNTDVAVTSRRAQDQPAQLHIFTRSGGGIWARSPSFQLSDNFAKPMSIGGKGVGLAISANWIAVTSSNENKVRFYKKDANGWSFSSEVAVRGFDLFGDFYGQVVMTDTDVAISAEGSGFGAGVVVLTRSGDVWTFDTFLAPFELQSNSYIETAAIHDDLLVIGAPNQPSAAGERGNGAVFIYRKQSNGGWTYEVVENPTGPFAKAGFGSRVAIRNSSEVLVYAVNRTEADAASDRALGVVYVLQEAHAAKTSAVALNLGVPTPITPNGPTRLWQYVPNDLAYFWLKWSHRFDATKYTVEIVSPDRPRCCEHCGKFVGGTQTFAVLPEKSCGLGYCYHRIFFGQRKDCSGRPYTFSWRVRGENSSGIGSYSPTMNFNEQ